MKDEEEDKEEEYKKEMSQYFCNSIIRIAPLVMNLYFILSFLLKHLKVWEKIKYWKYHWINLVCEHDE